MGSLTGKKELHHVCNVKKVVIELSLLLVVVLILSLCAGAAWGEEQVRDAGFGKHSSRAAAETCLPLLESIRQSSSSDVVARNQRSAGKLAALSLALGMRYALQPHSGQGGSAVLHKLALDNDDKGEGKADDKAMDIIQYRQCVKQNALQITMKAHSQNFAALR